MQTNIYELTGTLNRFVRDFDIWRLRNALRNVLLEFECLWNAPGAFIPQTKYPIWLMVLCAENSTQYAN